MATIILNGELVSTDSNATVLGGASSDAVTAAGALVGADVETKDGDDSIAIDMAGEASSGSKFNGNDDDDTLVVASGVGTPTFNSSLFGGSGDDTISAIGGKAILTNWVQGGSGDDVITVVRSTDNKISGNSGDDEINIGGTVTGLNADNLFDNVSVRGGQGDDTININAQANVSDGGAEEGSYVMADLGDDLINLAAGATIAEALINGNGGDDTITAAGALTTTNATVRGGQGDDVINVSGAGAMTVGGDLGADAITVGGEQTVSGGTGSDVFTISEAGVTITDFTNANTDIVDGSATGADSIKVAATGIAFSASNFAVTRSVADSLITNSGPFTGTISAVPVLNKGFTTSGLFKNTGTPAWNTGSSLGAQSGSLVFTTTVPFNRVRTTGSSSVTRVTADQSVVYALSNSALSSVALSNLNFGITNFTAYITGTANPVLTGSKTVRAAFTSLGSTTLTAVATSATTLSNTITAIAFSVNGGASPLVGSQTGLQFSFNLSAANFPLAASFTAFNTTTSVYGSSAGSFGSGIANGLQNFTGSGITYKQNATSTGANTLGSVTTPQTLKAYASALTGSAFISGIEFSASNANVESAFEAALGFNFNASAQTGVATALLLNSNELGALSNTAGTLTSTTFNAVRPFRVLFFDNAGADNGLYVISGNAVYNGTITTGLNATVGLSFTGTNTRLIVGGSADNLIAASDIQFV